jgi:signal transduction histidine kinase
MASQKSPWCGWRGLTHAFVLTAMVLLAFAGTNDPFCEISLVQAGGKGVFGPTHTNTGLVPKVELPSVSRLQRLIFSFGPVDAEANRPLRLLRKLEGWDRDWLEAGGDMQVSVAVYAASNRILSYYVFTMTGESEGWQGEAMTSVFHSRRESIVLPAGAERLQVLFIAKDWKGLGTTAIANFRVLRKNTAGSEENIWPDSNFEEGENLDRPDGQPRYWRRSSFGANLAHVSPLPPPMQGHALTIVDDDLHLPATWQADLPLKNKAQAGDTLKFEWKEAFSVGIGGRQRAGYDSLPPGDYVFRVKTVTPSGQPVGREAALAVSIPQVFWKRPPFVILGFVSFVAAITGIVRVAVRRRLQARMDRLEQRRQLEHERVRIAQDMHDDLGASLTQINLLSQTAHRKIENAHPAWKDTERLRALAVNLTQKLDEIVWAVSPRHDTFESLVSYLTDLAEEFLGSAGIRARIQVPLQLPSWTLPAGLRHNVFLATKEALNNVVKHAQATEVHLRLVILAEAFALTLEDNGRGFSPPPPSSPGPKSSGGHGLAGIRNRMAALGGQLTLDTAPGRGTRVTFTVPVKVANP